MRDSTVHDPVAARPAESSGAARLLAPTAAEWSAALGRCDHDTYHLPEYVVLEAGLTDTEPAAFWYAEDSRVFLVPLTLRGIPRCDRRDAISPYGYPAPISNAEPAETEFWWRACRAMVDTLRGHGIVTAFIRLHPLLRAPLGVLGDAGTVVRHGETVSVDLRLSAEEMWHQTRSDHRNHINRARRAGVQVLWDQWHRLDEWVAVYHDNMRRLGAADYYFVPTEHFAALHDALGDRMHLAVAVLDGEVLGGSTLFEYRGYIQGYLASTRRENSHHADKLLYDEVRRWTRARGNRIFHVGGGVGGAQDSLFAYKAGFGTGRHPFHTWRVVSDPDAYQVLLRRKGLTPDPGQLSGHFPAYR
jgi:Acetyltransferase (GNAT) domain